MAGSVSSRVWTSVVTIAAIVAATFYIEDRLEKKIDKSVSVSLVGVVEDTKLANARIAALETDVANIKKQSINSDYHYKTSAIAMSKMIDFINHKFNKEFIRPDDIIMEGER